MPVMIGISPKRVVQLITTTTITAGASITAAYLGYRRRRGDDPDEPGALQPTKDRG